MNKSFIPWLCLFCAFLLPLGKLGATPMALDMSSALNYDAVGTSDELNWISTTYPSGNRRLTDIIGGQNLANAGRALTTTASLASGTGLPPFGVIGVYTTSFAYQNYTGGKYVSSSNCLRIIASATSSGMVSASSTITFGSGQQLNYTDLNLLFVQNRSAGAGTFRTLVTATYTDSTTTVLDSGSITVAGNAPGGTLGSAGVASQGGLSISTDTNAAVSNVFSSPYGIATGGTTGNQWSVINSSVGSNLWQLATPIALNSAKVLKSVTIQVQAAQSGQWNELAVFGMCATPSAYKAPPMSDPVEALNVTFDPGRLAAHPRIMMTPATIPALKAFYSSTAGALWAGQINSYLGACVIPTNSAFLTDATEAQRQGFWRLPTIALHYVLTGNTSSFANALGFLQLFCALPDWETTSERNSGMSAANILTGAALAYDWLYNDLDPVFRETLRQKLILQARALYYGGHLEYNSSVAAIYWQMDPFNNHRWDRDSGLGLAVMATFSGASSENWLMNRTASELALINNWLPADGSHHESVSYLIFGGNHLMLGQQVSDDCLGTHFLDAPFFAQVGVFRLQAALSSFDSGLDFGDFSDPDLGGYSNFLLKAAAHFHNADLHNGLVTLATLQPTAFTFGWFSLLWDDPTLTGGNYKNLPLTGYYGNLGLEFCRDSWAVGGVSAMFKCCPLGGVQLNLFRSSSLCNLTYLNVAHDDPDANSFVVYCGEDQVAADDQYSTQKNSTQQNTILVNGGGQNPVGRTDAPQGFSQPASNGVSMMPMATSFPSTTLNGATITEGEAAGSYPAITTGSQTRPAISRFRRLFLWSPTNYILVLDDLRSAQAATFTWLVQGPNVTTVNSSQGLFNLVAGSHTCGFQVAASQALSFATVASTADNRGVSLGYQQLRASATGTSMRIASIFNPWQKTGLTVALQNATSTGCDVAVSGSGISDTYHWTFATGSSSPSTLTGPPPPAPAITSALTASGTSNVLPFHYSITASNSPTSFNAAGLPPGLNVNTSTGVISGTATASGTYSSTISAANVGGTGSATLVVTIASPPPLPPVITSGTMAGGVVGSSFTFITTAINYPTNFSVTGLPAGLAMNAATGVISGTPAAIGTFSVIVGATNSFGTGSATLLLTVSPAYYWSNLAGNPGVSGTADGTGINAGFGTGIVGLAVDGGSNVYVADLASNTIRKVTSAGVVITLAGSRGVTGTSDGTGSAAQFNQPKGVAVDGSGNIYVADSGNNTIRKVTPVGVVTTLAGRPGATGTLDGTGSVAQFNAPRGIAVDSIGNVYVADTSNDTLRKITPAGVVTTLAGSPGVAGATDGTGGAARFNMLRGLVVDGGTNIYVADDSNNTIRKVTQAGVVTTLAGAASASGGVDGIGGAVRFSSPYGIAMDASGCLYVGDSVNNSIRKMIASGTGWMVTNIGGSFGQAGASPGTGNAARFNTPFGVGVDGAGAVYVLDSNNDRVAKGALLSPPIITSALTGTAGAGTGFNYQITASNTNTAPPSFNASYNATGLPTGLTLDAASGLISGTATTSGISSVTISATNPAGSGTATLLLTIAGSYNLWQSANFTPVQLAVPGIVADTASPAGDDIPNLMKYALNLDAMTNGVGGLPVVGNMVISGSDYLTLSYTQVIAATDITSTVEVSGDVQIWNSGSGYTSVVSITPNANGVTQTVVVRDLTPMSSAAKRFMRLKVTRP